MTRTLTANHLVVEAFYAVEAAKKAAVEAAKKAAAEAAEAEATASAERTAA